MGEEFQYYDFSLQSTVIEGGRGAGAEESRSFLKAWSVNLKSVGDNVSQYFPAGSFVMIQSAVTKLCSVTAFACLLISTHFLFHFPSRGVSTPRVLLWVSVKLE